MDNQPITWKQFKECVEAQGVDDETTVYYLNFRSWLMQGDKYIRPRVRITSEGTAIVE